MSKINEHISDETLMLYYAERGKINLSGIKAIETHLGQCTVCREELKELEEAESELRNAAKSRHFEVETGETTWDKIRALLLHPAFAYAVLVIIAVPMALLWRSEKAQPGSEISPIPQAIQLRESTRSVGSVQVIEKSTSDNLIRLRVPYPYQLASSYYKIGLQSDDNGSASSVVTFSRFEEPGQIDLLIEARTLVDGIYTLEVLEIGRDSFGDTLSTSFVFELKTPK